MTVLGVVLLLLGGVYAVTIGLFAVGFREVVRGSRSPSDEARSPETPLPAVSVLVPARDEAGVIERCLETILACDYPADRFEVIVVDDLSEDDTAAVVSRVMQRVNAPVLAGGEEAADPERLRLLRMPDNLERTRAHKKRAIEKGIAHARGSLILTTDADCSVPRGWIRAMATRFPDLGAQAGPVTAFVSGPVRYRAGGDVFARLQALEFLGLVAVGAGAIGAGRPTICNGANVAYRKDVFESLGGFS
ncbi:MAG: glycosyltransferase, partial [Rubricoccaceae bacterium]|nr:glycosyltransferase [Rubricoccaceae bacterium]